jgi:hypothetical protein
MPLAETLSCLSYLFSLKLSPVFHTRRSSRRSSLHLLSFIPVEILAETLYVEHHADLHSPSLSVTLVTLGLGGFFRVVARYYALSTGGTLRLLRST